ncbi:hypothetical protein BDR03DRAFT_958091 [Suillus americanus]|nr:hypothetical protein BDR03DRAFT_958091 [Suillus americanus]
MAAITGTYKVASQAPTRKEMPHRLKLTLKGHERMMNEVVVPVSSLLAPTTRVGSRLAETSGQWSS